MTLNEELYLLKDDKYKEFHKKLIPTVAEDTIIGVRAPMVHELVKKYSGTKEAEDFLQELPHKYYDENLLHGLLIANIKNMNECLEKVEEFLPYVDNWAVCDLMTPKVFRKHKDQLFANVLRWIASDKVYTQRFGIKMLMDHFLEKEFKPEYLKIPANIETEEYYVKMMIAWFYATALAKQWESTFEYIKAYKLEVWIHNKSIQKACESRRITDEQKMLLRQYKI